MYDYIYLFASIYPDAVENLSSASVIEGQLQKFSRTVFPKEMQYDLGRYLTNELTLKFLDRFGIKVIHSSVCHPKSNSFERIHNSLEM